MSMLSWMCCLGWKLLALCHHSQKKSLLQRGRQVSLPSKPDNFLWVIGKSTGMIYTVQTQDPALQTLIPTHLRYLQLGTPLVDIFESLRPLVHRRFGLPER